LQQLESIENLPERNDKGLLNFKKMASLGKCVSVVATFRTIPYNIPRDSYLLKLFKDYISAPQIEDMATLSMLSRKCENTVESIVSPAKQKKGMELEKWYLGSIDRAQAENILSQCDYNAFLIRRSSVPGSYAISFWNFQKKSSFHTICTPKS
jgi:hypothetical protein